jgi:hypothetical protein
VRRARDRQPPEVARRLVLQAPVDLSGAFAELPALRGKTLSAPELASLGQRALARVLAAVPERFDVVLSACCLSQIMHSCFEAVGRHPQLPAIARALALVHLRSLAELLRPGGRAILATDTVSTETYPLLEMWGSTEPTVLLADLEAAGNFLSGTAASEVRGMLAKDPGIAALCAGPPRLVEPWLWRLSEQLTLLVYAFVIRRR